MGGDLFEQLRLSPLGVRVSTASNTSSTVGARHRSRGRAQHTVEHPLDIDNPVGRSRHPARNVAVGIPASTGFAARVASVIVLCALPTSTGDGFRPSRSTNPGVHSRVRSRCRHPASRTRPTPCRRCRRCRPDRSHRRHRTRHPTICVARHAGGSGTRRRPLSPADTNHARRGCATHRPTRCAPRWRSTRDHATADPTPGSCDADTGSPTHPSASTTATPA